ncbi:rgs domain-containing protein [Lineolata rhizophorae]|uniref:Rgs domain-containing protein n=1 Tax=Lineolata rhizophorae TaxID=578093 RepID=A0A6A6NNY1_9PEZI|nr:rgs domain-containing protein [Lineolata rhizophorae]
MATTPSPEPLDNRHRLPTLGEVLFRRTLPPVDLFSFYIYMRDQQRSVDYLDFWLDVTQHMSLCRHYVRELRRSNLIETPELEKAGSKRSSAVLDNMEQAGPSTEKQTPEQRVSAFLRTDSGSRHSHQNSQGSGQSMDRPRPSFMGTSVTNSPHNDSTPSGANASTSPGHTVARSDLKASAVKILYTYLLPGSEREIILPQGILNEITTHIEQNGRDDPEVFDAAKDYVFQAMERDAFPGFLKAKALGNIVPPSGMARLVAGLICMFGAFWTAFVLIFLDYPRSTRCFVIIPFAIGVYALLVQQYTVEPITAIPGYSEYTFMTFSRIREPFIRRLLIKRALMVLLWTVLVVAALSCLFIFVPGKRL